MSEYVGYMGRIICPMSVDRLRLRERPKILPIGPRDLALCRRPILPLEKEIAIAKARLILDFLARLHSREDTALHVVNRLQLGYGFRFRCQTHPLGLPLKKQRLSASVSRQHCATADA